MTKAFEGLCESLLPVIQQLGQIETKQNHWKKGWVMRSFREEGPGSSDCPYLTFGCSSVTPVPLVSSWNPDLAVFEWLVQQYPCFLGGGLLESLVYLPAPPGSLYEGT